jgi:hypothetical protein
MCLWLRRVWVRGCICNRVRVAVGWEDGHELPQLFARSYPVSPVEESGGNLEQFDAVVVGWVSKNLVKEESV